MMQASDLPVITIIELTPKASYREEALEAIQTISLAAAGFHGYQSADIFEKVTAGGAIVFAIILRFDTYANLTSWNDSEQKARQIALSKNLFTEVTPEVKLTGLEFWFENKQQEGVMQPTKWKILIITVCIIFILLHTLMPFIRQLLRPIGMPQMINTLVGIIMMVTLMTYVVMPFITRIFSKWLFKSKG